ncbi:MAG: L,D-transpeptidase [Desulfobacteraceae bacterium]|nr:L,D-transpeptidase [Desulfobacteraceae bacterium]
MQIITDDVKDTQKADAFIFMKAALLVVVVVLTLCYYGLKNNSYAKEPFQNNLIGDTVQGDVDDGLWDGPILFYKGNGKPIHLILVEKAFQKLRLYTYDGRYKLIKSYNCSTGEQPGKKQNENDEKTPEGIYFNIKSYRDSKVTLFGDRAFGLNYPDIFDSLEGNCGNGIFIHGSNQTIKPFSTNGCVVLNTRDLADLDRRASLKKTPVIIANHLPYRFEPAKKQLSELMRLLKQAMLPESYRSLNREFRHIAVIGFQKRVVAVGEVRIKDSKNTLGFSRLYLYRPGKDLMVLLKREWSEE